MHADFDIAVIGAGPAGLSAAAAAIAEGMNVIVVDERLSAGGALAGSLGASARDPDSAWLIPPLHVTHAERGIIEALCVAASEAILLLDSLVWGVFPSWTIAVSRAGLSTERVDVNAIVLATGSYVARPPFVGFERDGVITPLGLVRAVQTGVLDSSSRVAVLGDNLLADKVIDFLEHERVDAITVIGTKRRNTRHQHFVISSAPIAGGAPRISSLNLILEDRNRIELGIDWLVVTEPVSASSDLANLAGCEHEYLGASRGFVPRQSSVGSTSVERLFLAGSLSGETTVQGAIDSGRRAGVAAASAVRGVARRFHAVTEKSGNSDRSSEHGMSELFVTELDYASTAPFCRCTGARFNELSMAINAGCRSLDEVKRFTRAGMGECQGRDCNRFVVAALERQGQVDLSSIRANRVRAPIRPLLARAMLEADSK